MALAKICDVCGTFYAPYNSDHETRDANGIRFLTVLDSGAVKNHEGKDCCEECMKAIKGYLDILREGRKVKGNVQLENRVRAEEWR